MPDATRIRVETAAPYDVVVGNGLLGELPSLVGDGARRVAVVHPRALASRGQVLRDDLSACGFDAHALEVPDAEAAKTTEVAAGCWKALGRLGFTRSDVVVGVGGGATTDLAGFVAATFMRGLRLVQVPTTLLGMVDAAIGGKTGVNTAEGKNLVGAFHEPAGVLCDLDSLVTLDRGEIVSGLAEVVKCGFVADEAILLLVEADASAAVDPASASSRELIERAVRVKASVVADDLVERTSRGTDVGREALNYGHTLGHAIERAGGYSSRHGEAVSVGMVFVAQLARLAGRLDGATAERHGSILTSLGLPTRYRGSSWPELLGAMKVDKKSRGDMLRFVVIERVGRPAILEAPSTALLDAAYAEIAR